MYWFLEALKKYAVFSGRARRKEFWYFQLFNFLFAMAYAIVLLVLFSVAGHGDVSAYEGTPFQLLFDLYALALFLPSLGVSVRRLHDTNRSGWWVLLGLIPFIGAIVLLIFYVQDGEPGTNQYGPNPKEATLAPV